VNKQGLLLNELVHSGEKNIIQIYFEPDTIHSLNRIDESSVDSGNTLVL